MLWQLLCQERCQSPTSLQRIPKTPYFPSNSHTFKRQKVHWICYTAHHKSLGMISFFESRSFRSLLDCPIQLTACCFDAVLMLVDAIHWLLLGDCCVCPTHWLRQLYLKPYGLFLLASRGWILLVQPPGITATPKLESSSFSS